MASLRLVDIWDGDQGPALSVELRDSSGAVLDSSSCAVSLEVTDAAGVSLGTFPGIPQSPRSDGIIYFYLPGACTDLDGDGGTLLAYPKIYMALDANGDAATNLLINPSFDTYTGGAGVADSWTQSATLGPTVYEVKSDDPAPPVIFGSCQRVYTPSSGATAYLTQTPSVTLAAGDAVSAGVWTRATLDAGASLAGANYAVKIVDGADSFANALTSGDRDWTFATVTGVCTTSHSALGLRLVAYDAIGYDVRFDDAILFAGSWGVTQPDYFEINVKARTRSPKNASGANTNQIAGFGDFGRDSNSDGVADGWTKSGTDNTYTIDPVPADVSTGTTSQKVVLGGGASGNSIRCMLWGNFAAGETWRAQVSYKTSGTLTGSPADGDFGLVLHTDPFDGTYETSSLTGSNFAMTASTFTVQFRTITLTAAHNALVFDINLNGATGTMWLDTAMIFRTAP